VRESGLRLLFRAYLSCLRADFIVATSRAPCGGVPRAGESDTMPGRFREAESVLPVCEGFFGTNLAR